MAATDRYQAVTGGLGVSDTVKPVVAAVGSSGLAVGMQSVDPTGQCTENQRPYFLTQAGWEFVIAQADENPATEFYREGFANCLKHDVSRKIKCVSKY